MDSAPRHVSAAELEQGLADVLDSPSDVGTLESIIIRPAVNERRTLRSVTLTPEGGIDGDRWVREQGHDPLSQVSIMNSRILRQIAASDDAICLAGDNLVVDFDLSESNVPPGTRLAIGPSVIIDVNGESHTGCGKFQRRYGKEARAFINNERGMQLHLRGRYASIVAGGTITVGDTVRKLPLDLNRE